MAKFTRNNNGAIIEVPDDSVAADRMRKDLGRYTAVAATKKPSKAKVKAKAEEVE